MEEDSGLKFSHLAWSLYLYMLKDISGQCLLTWTLGCRCPVKFPHPHRHRAGVPSLEQLLLVNASKGYPCGSLPLEKKRTVLSIHIFTLSWILCCNFTIGICSHLSNILLPYLSSVVWLPEVIRLWQLSKLWNLCWIAVTDACDSTESCELISSLLGMLHIWTRSCSPSHAVQNLLSWLSTIAQYNSYLEDSSIWWRHSIQSVSVLVSYVNHSLPCSWHIYP